MDCHIVNVYKAVDITRSVANFLINTNHYLAAIGFIKELLMLANVAKNSTSSYSSSQDRMKMAIFDALAFAYFYVGNYRDAKANAKFALRISKQIEDKDGERTFYLYLFRVFKALGRDDKAIKYLKLALKVSKIIGDAKVEAEIHLQLGVLEDVFLGQHEKAKEHQLKSVQLSKDIGDKATQVRALCILGQVFCALGKPMESFEKHGEALKISEEIGDGSLKAMVLFDIGMHFQQTDNYDKAMEYYQRSLLVSKEIHNSVLERNACRQLGTMLSRAKKYVEAVKYLNKALELSTTEEHRREREAICIELFKICLVLGQHDKAMEYRQKVIECVMAAGVRDVTRSSVFVRLALGYAADRNMQQACDMLSEGIKYYENERAILSEEYKLPVGDKQQSIDIYKIYCYVLIFLGRVLDALCIADQGRARILGELLSKKYAIQEKVELGKYNIITSLISLLTKKQILVFINAMNVSTFFWIMAGEGGRKLELVYRAESSETDVHNLLESRLQKNFRSLAIGQDIECEDRSLSALYDSESTAEDENDKRNKGKRLVESVEEEYEDTNASHQLYNMLVAPFAHRIEGQEVVLVLEGSMFVVPFPALQDLQGRYLSEKCRFRVIPSLTALKLIHDSPADFHSQAGALIVGDPDVSRVKRLRQLPAARQEAKEIAELLNVSPLLGEQATKKEVLRRITDVCLIHIAAHGDAERGEIACTPNLSSPRVPRKEDFLLTMEDVAKVGIRAKLVVLSCCHSGRGKIMKSEGVMGIARAFIASGARSVLVSLWLLNDESTKEFMIRFYGHLVRDKLSASEALHQSTKWMRESKKYSVSDWAPFVLIGDDVPLLDL
ncbi:tetratricopeptide repeat protein 28-like [Oculina patagonica]